MAGAHRASDTIADATAERQHHGKPRHRHAEVRWHRHRGRTSQCRFVAFDRSHKRPGRTRRGSAGSTHDAGRFPRFGAYPSARSPLRTDTGGSRRSRRMALVRPRTRRHVSARRSLAADLDADDRLAVVGVVALARRGCGRGPLGRLAGRQRPWWRRPVSRAASAPCSWMNSAHSTRVSTISSSGTTITFWPFTNRWPRLFPAAMPRSASRASPGPLTTHPMTATCSGISRVAERRHRVLFGDRDTSTSARPTARTGDEVDVLALPQAQDLEQLPTGLRLLDRVGGERVADGVADALGQQRGDARGGLEGADRVAGPPRSRRDAAGGR